ncbi:TIGR03750 family conjugal transfer protein [Variovorax sp. ZS18.2.2]|uniref:TIGR03750 family conjugal transfer protein n=1 Tax=Variovorax sp. ZS18.2.2 TaxID=2971255 RepID=UPI0021517FB1|nr:TIGR03750 family conjugal transfer protein [Variovorax sp. ZS18.2.2]MCR6480986.1 TIGR03750 family conjugal transfer protein [Variovorax sp. ZS18.2.2]
MSEKIASQASASGSPGGMDAARARAPVTDRVNAEPSILNGMTLTEAQVIAVASLAVFVVIGGLVFAVTGLWQVLMLLSIFGPGVTLWYASTFLQRVKRGRPDAYYTQSIHLWLAERSLVRPKFIRHDGWWEIGRSLDFSLASALEPNADDLAVTAAPALASGTAPRPALLTPQPAFTSAHPSSS